jgi:predicted molibdopterin-dependent oxidoreductase YjgC
MLDLTINGKSYQADEGTRVLAACREAGVDIPTLCWLDGHPHFTSCMVCVVKDVNQDRLIPACSALVTDGMVIETDSAEVIEGRRVAVELLLSEHIGDCLAPCQRVCPLELNIPQLIRYVAAGNIPAAAEIIKTAQANSDVTCATCKAPCEKACRRRRADQPIAIRQLIEMVERYRPTTEDGRQRTEIAESAPNSLQPRTKNQELRTSPRFDSRIGALQPGDMDAFMAGASQAPQQPPKGDHFTSAEAVREAERCLHCDCRKPIDCKLRQLAGAYEARQSRYKRDDPRPAIEIHRDHPDIIFEPGKCITCGICTRIAEAAGENPGLTFLQRGIATRIGVPFGDSLQSALTRDTALRCADACPTAALSRREREKSAF